MEEKINNDEDASGIGKFIEIIYRLFKFASSSIISACLLYTSKFVAKGIPVVIGEFGSINKGNDSARVQHAKDFIEVATKRNITCIWWDNNLSLIHISEQGKVL